MVDIELSCIVLLRIRFAANVKKFVTKLFPKRWLIFRGYAVKPPFSPLSPRASPSHFFKMHAENGDISAAFLVALPLAFAMTVQETHCTAWLGPGLLILIHIGLSLRQRMTGSSAQLPTEPHLCLLPSQIDGTQDWKVLQACVLACNDCHL
jgi:hypothetical protein